MYAVIQTGGKQYRVQAGDVIQVEKLEGEVGSAIQFKEILFASNPAPAGSTDASQVWIGAPLLKGASVDSEVVGQGRGDKVRIVKMKRRKQYRRTQGHRQNLTQLLITQVSNGAGQTVTMSDADKKTLLATFSTQLKPKGLPSTPKTLGSRKRMAAAAKDAKAAAPAAEAKKTKKA